MGDGVRRELTSQQAERLLDATLSKVLAASSRRLLQLSPSLGENFLDGPDQAQSDGSSVGVLWRRCSIASGGAPEP